MLHACKVRLKPTADQKTFLAGQFGAVRFVWNKALAIKQHYWRVHGENLDPVRDLKPLLAVAKRSRKYAWLKDYDSIALQEAVRHLDRAWANFYARRAGMPHFHSKRGNQSSYHCTGIAVGDRWVRIPKLGRIKAIVHRELPTGQPGFRLRSITLSRNTLGEYYAALLYEDGVPAPAPAAAVAAERVVGMDLGLKTFATLSTGEEIPNPRTLQHAQQRLRQYQKRLARRVQGSRNREKARRQLAKLHLKTARKREDFLHQVSCRLVNDNQVIVGEDLSSKNLMCNHRLAVAIGDASWGRFVTMLRYKSAQRGIRFIQVNRFFPSSKRCPHCHAIHENLKLSDRVWMCPHCGRIIRRDFGAAVNLRDEGLIQLRAAGLSVRREVVI